MTKKTHNLIILILTIILVLTGLIFISTAFIPFNSIKTEIDSMTSDGNAGFFTINFYIMLKHAGLLIILIGIFLKPVSQKINTFSNNLSMDTKILFRTISHKISDFFKLEDKLHLIIFFLIFIISILIRLDFINQPIRYDEAHNFVYFAEKPLVTAFSNFNSNNHHLLHTILTHVSYKIFGASLWAIRLPALIFGILTVPAVYVAARTLYNKKAALISMGIISASSIMIEFSTNARGYTMVCFFFLIILCIAKYLKDNNNMFAWLIFIIVSALGLFTMLIMLYPLCIVILWLLISVLLNNPVNRKKTVKSIIISTLLIVILTFILYSPVIAKTGFIPAFSRDIAGLKPWSSFINDQWIYVKEIWDEWNRDIPIILALFFEFCFFISLLLHNKFADHKINFFIPAIIVFIPVQLMLKNYLIFTRYWLFLLPLYLMISAAGFVFISDIIQNKIRIKKSISIVIPVVSLILSIGLCLSVFFSHSILDSYNTGLFKEGENITIYLKDNLKEKDIVISDGFTQPILLYYFEKNNIPQAILYDDLKKISSNLSSIDNIYVVILKDKELKTFIEGYAYLLYNYNLPLLTKTYDSSYVYEIQRLK